MSKTNKRATGTKAQATTTSATKLKESVKTVVASAKQTTQEVKVESTEPVTTFFTRRRVWPD